MANPALASRPLPRTAAPVIRAATLADVRELARLEEACFDSDRLSQRQFRYMLTRAHAAMLVAEQAEGLVGYVLVLFRRGTSLGRVYSIAVAPQWRSRGIGRALLEAAEETAAARDCAYLRLEVRQDNDLSIALYRGQGYRPIGVVPDYYEDGMAALRLEKALAPHLDPRLHRVPYYEQTLDFTCGASALMMAMKALDAESELSRTLELRLWREATTIFMTSGHGGCGPFGLALSATRRGFEAEVFVNDAGVPLVDTVRSPAKKEVMRLVHEEMLEETREAGIPVHYFSLDLSELEERFDEGGIPIVLISSYRLSREKMPHWVVVTGFEERFVYVNDPFVDRKRGDTATLSMDTPIPRHEFSRMSRYGRAGLQAVVMIYRKGERPAG